MSENRPGPIRLVVLDPGHFHAALVLKRHRTDVDPLVHVYAPEGQDLEQFRAQVEAFNLRAVDPTNWRLTIRAGTDWLKRFQSERPGNTVVIAGRNKPKITTILAALEAGLNVLADKPWIIDTVDFSMLEQARDRAVSNGRIAWDMMTERHETTNRLLLALVREEAIFGTWIGSPAFDLESVHCLQKTVAGSPLRRPAWWFDPAIAGDSLADVGTHLVDLALMAIAPEQIVRPEDVRIISQRQWSLPVSRTAYQRITGLPGEFEGEQLEYAGNGTMECTIRGVPVRVTTRWEIDHPGGDWHDMVAHGSRCTIRSQQSLDGRRQVFIVPGTRILQHAVDDWCARSHAEFPGLTAEYDGNGIRFVIPDRIRLDHESLFARVFTDYSRLFHEPDTLAPWDWPNRLVRYRLTTRYSDGCSRGDPSVP